MIHSYVLYFLNLSVASKGTSVVSLRRLLHNRMFQQVHDFY